MTVYYSDYIPASAGSGIEGRSVIDLTSTSFADLFSQAQDYNSGTTYTKGTLVYNQNSTWVYINSTSGSGNAPPTLPTFSNAYWELVGTTTNNTFVWIAYADSVDGITFTNFTTGDSGTRSWIGIATNKTSATESTNSADYSWSRFVGANGTPGAAATSAYLTNESIQLFAYANGNVVNYNGATGLFKVFAGSTDVSTSFTLSTQTNPQGLTINYTGQTYTVSNGFDASEDTATVTIRATGSGTYAGVILDKVLSLSKAKGGYEIVAALPSTDLFEGRMVFLTADDKLYRYTGAAWTSAVPAADIAGQIADAQIAAISTTKLSGQVTDAQIAALGAAKLTGQITATQITDTSISTSKLAAGSVVTDKIAASAVTASKLVVTGENLFPDPYCQDLAWWFGPGQGTLTSNGYSSPSNPSNTDAGGFRFIPNAGNNIVDLGGGKGNWQLISSGGYTGAGYSDVVTPSFPIKSGTTYEFSCGVLNNSNKVLFFNLQVFDGNGTFQQEVTLATYAANSGASPSQRFQFTIPGNCVAIRLYWSIAAGAAFSGLIRFGNITVREAAGATMIVNGAIVADKLAANAVVADKIAANAIRTQHLLVAPNNLNPDPQFRDTAAWLGYRNPGGVSQGSLASNTVGWYMEDYVDATGVGIDTDVIGNRFITLWNGRAGQDNTAVHHVYGFQGLNNFIRVRSGQVLELKAGCQNTTNHTIHVRAEYFNDAFTAYYGSGELVWVSGDWSVKSTQLTIPTNCTCVRLIIFNNGSGSTLINWARVSNISLRDTVGASMIIDGSVTATKVAANAVTADKIEAGAITAAKLAATNVITTSAQIADAVITSAKIGDLQVENAKIANLTVGTSKITNNAVTTPVYAYTAGGVLISATTTIQSVTITTSGEPVKIDLSYMLSATTSSSIRLTRNGTNVIPTSTLMSNNGQVLVSFSLGDTPAAGTHTYNLIAQASGTVPQAFYRSLFVLGIKK